MGSSTQTSPERVEYLEAAVADIGALVFDDSARQRCDQRLRLACDIGDRTDRA